MKKFARNQLARQLFDLPNCGAALFEGVEDFFLQSLRRLHKTAQVEPLHEPIGAALAVSNARIYAGRCPILAFWHLRPLNPLKFDAELAVVLLAAHSQLPRSCLLAMDF